MNRAATLSSYALWLAFHPAQGAAKGPTVSQRRAATEAAWRPALGYGATPHGQRLEGYPRDLTRPEFTALQHLQSEAFTLPLSPSRVGSLRAMDAASRPEKPAPLLSLNAEIAL